MKKVCFIISIVGLVFSMVCCILSLCGVSDAVNGIYAGIILHFSMEFSDIKNDIHQIRKGDKK